uniref:Sulfotransfer_1 domain-containing protein n=1 Tax=Caenorhabditis tropicalis TaxID=1561998 RepID=A0A1I7T1K0_9PELO
MIFNRRVLICVASFVFLLFECVYLIGVFTRKRVEVVEEKERLPGDNITDFIPPFVPLLNDYALVAGYNLLGCNIRKSMSQLNYNLLCYLNNTELFVENNQSLSDLWYDKRTSCQNISSNTYNPLFQDGSMSLDQITKFAFIRHPEERFVSFFVDKCLKENYCLNCTDVRCASKLIYDRLMALASNRSLFIKDDETWWFEWHSAPQTWNCDFYKDLKDFHLIPIGTSLEQRQIAMRKLSKVLEFAGVEDEHIEKIVKDTVESDTHHATHGSILSQRVLQQVG